MRRLSGPAVKQAQRFARAPVEIPNVRDDDEAGPDVGTSVTPDHTADGEREAGAQVRCSVSDYLAYLAGLV
jgi:hypothetical protein